MRRSIEIFALVALSGCTLAIDGLEPPPCENNTQCAVLNEIDGIAQSACELHQCSVRALCEMGARDLDRDGRVAPECAHVPLAQGLPVDCNDEVPGGTEICNGIDDDCDGVIDEHYVLDGVAYDPLPPAPPDVLVAGTFAASGSVGYGVARGGLAIGHTDGGSARFALLSGASASGPVPMSYARTRDLASLSSNALETGCHEREGDGSVVEGDCNFAEIALGLSGEHVFSVAISRAGCVGGEVRVGYFPRSATLGAVIERGPLRRSNAFVGIDYTLASPCTGASRTSSVRGATGPTVAALDLEEDQALAAWLADSAPRTGCGGTEVDVEVLGLHVQEDTSGAAYGWITASDEGIPQVVGTTTQGGRPGIGTWENTGYLVGFGAPGGGVRLVFVEMMSRPPAFVDGDASSRVGLETGPLAIADLGAVATGGAADDVVIAFGSVRSGGVDVGLAWREGCGSGRESVRFRQLFLARSGSTVSIAEDRSYAPIDLTAEPTSSAGPPSIAFVYSGMLAIGVQRPDGRPTGAAGNDGGWVVAWSDASNPEPGPTLDSRILARRISEADGALLAADELLVLNAPGDVARLRPALYSDAEDRVLFAFHAVGEGYRGGALTCASAAP